MHSGKLIGAAWKMNGNRGPFISVELDMGFMGSANVFLFPREDKSYSAWIKRPGKKEKEVGSGWEEIGVDRKPMIVAKLRQGLLGGPLKIMILAREKDESSNPRLPDYMVYLERKKSRDNG